MRGEEGVVARPRLSRDTDLRVLPPDAALHILLAQTQGEASCGEGRGEGGREERAKSSNRGRRNVRSVGVEVKDGAGWCWRGEGKGGREKGREETTRNCVGRLKTRGGGVI